MIAFLAIAAQVADLRALSNELSVPAVGAVWVQRGLITAEVAGVSQVNGQEPVSKNALWHLGSNTKALTAILALRLLEKRRIDPDQKVFPLLGIPTEAWHHLTIRHLLDQTGGLPETTYMGSSVWWADKRPIREQRRSYAEAAAKLTPGARTFRYSNANYVLLGAVCEFLGDACWEDLLVREVLRPLGIQKHAFGPVPKGSPQPHVFQGGKLGPLPSGMPGDNAAAIAPAGGLSLSLEGYGRWMKAIVERNPVLLSRESWNVMFGVRPETLYVAGWLVVWQNGKPRQLTHFGSNTLHTFGCWIDLERKRGAALGVNAASEAIQQTLNQRLTKWILQAD